MKLTWGFPITCYFALLAAAPAAALEPEAILRLGVARSTESIPMLQQLAAKPGGGDEQHAARLALARLGDQAQVRRLIRDLSRKRPLQKRLRALRALGYVQDKSVVKNIIPLLSEGGELEETALETLGELLPQTRTRLLLTAPDDPDRAGQWRRWWNDAKELPPASYDELP